jgi:hypothetical protein
MLARRKRRRSSIRPGTPEGTARHDRDGDAAPERYHRSGTGSASAGSDGRLTPAGPQYDEYGQPITSGWANWVVFAGVMLVVLGCFHAIDGLVALFRDKYYVVRPSGLVVHVNYTARGWAHIVLGIVALATGAGLLRGNAVARLAAVVVAVVSAIVNLAFISAEPAWSLIVITLDVIIIYAVIVHGEELRGRHR